MEAEITRLREEFLTGARERIVQAGGTLEKLSGGTVDLAALRTARGLLHGLSHWGKVHGFPSAAATCLRLVQELGAALVLGGAPTAGELARWRAALDQARAELSSGDGGRWAAREGGRFVLFTRRPDHFAGTGASRCAFDASCCDLVERSEALPEALAGQPILAVVLDLAVPVAELIEGVRLVRASGDPWHPAPPILALTEGVGVLDRYRLTQAGVPTILPMDAPVAEAGRAVAKLLREVEVHRGTAFVLGVERDLRDPIEKDLAAEGLRVWSFADLGGLLRQWLEATPDVVVVLAARGNNSALKVARDLRDDRHSNRVAIVVATDKPDLETRRAAFEAGADACVALPLLPVEVSALVRHHVDTRHVMAVREPEPPVRARGADGRGDEAFGADEALERI